MLTVVMESLIEAYDYFPFPDLKFVFAVEAPNDKKVLEIVKSFPLDTEKIIVRQERCGLSKNILEGMKVAMGLSEDFVMFQADDIVVHKTFFKYYDKLINTDLGKISTYTVARYEEGGDPAKVIKWHAYDAAGALINKNFYETYIRPCSIPQFYNSRPAFVTQIDRKYNKYYVDHTYKFPLGPAKFNQQAGLINRLVDVAMIEEGYKTIISDLTRVRNIGFYGRNRAGNLPGNTFDDRLEFLRSIINDSDKIYSMTGSKQYKDYVNFDPRLDTWDGEIIIQEKK